MNGRFLVLLKKEFRSRWTEEFWKQQDLHKPKLDFTETEVNAKQFKGDWECGSWPSSQVPEPWGLRHFYG
jgi:hypothetical protein